MKEVKIKIKDEVTAFIFNPDDPPDDAYRTWRSIDDSSGIFEIEDWLFYGEKVQKGDIILFKKYGLNNVSVIVIPPDAIDLLVEIK